MSDGILAWGTLARALHDSSRLRRVARSSLVLVTVFALFGCASVAKIEGEDGSSISKLDASFRLFARAGEPPLEIPRNEKVSRYSVKVPGKPSEYLVLVFPEYADGALNLPSQASKQTFEISGRYKAYVDLLLRTHRLILKGQLKDATALLRRIDERFDETYGALILKGNIALLEGRDLDAAKHFKFAVRLFPDANLLPAAEEQ